MSGTAPGALGTSIRPRLRPVADIMRAIERAKMDYMTQFTARQVLEEYERNKIAYSQRTTKE